jgi:hypothetical protein
VALFDSNKERQRLTKKLVPYRQFVPSSENQTEEEVFFDFVTWYFNNDAEYFGGAIASQDRQHFRLRERRSGRLIVEIPKVSPEFWGKMFAKFMVFQIKPDHPRRRPIDRDIVTAAAERWQRLKNSRIVAKQRFRRNNQEERRTHNAIMAALAERQRWRMSVEDKAHQLNELAKRDPDVRDQVTLYTWRGGLPIPLRDGHIIRKNLHAYTPKKRTPNYPRRIPKRG